MLKKREPTNENSLKNWSKNGAKIHQKALPKSMQKNIKKRSFKFEVGGRGGIPKPIISKDILRSEVRRKYTKKVEWRVSAKWSAKSEVQRESAKRQVQRVSAERQVQTRNTHRTQTRSVVATTCGSMGYRLFRRPLILGLCVWGFGLWVCGMCSGF